MKTQPVQARERLILRAESLDDEGRAIAPHEGVEVIAPGLFVGELAEIEIEAVSRQHPRAFGSVIRHLETHPLRRESPCPSDAASGGECTGCPLLSLEPEAQYEAHQRSLLLRHGLRLERILSAEVERYRMASKRIAFDTQEGIEFGSYRRGSNLPARMEGCVAESPRIIDAIEEVREEARARGISSRLKNGASNISGLWLKTDGNELLLTLLGDAPHDARIVDLARVLQKSSGVFYSERASKTNALRGGSPIHLAGKGVIRSALFGVEQELGPLGFLQPNPAAAALAYQELLEGAQGGALAFDLYAGAGLITRKLRERFERVIPCEAFAESARALDIEPMRAEDFLENARAQGLTPSLIVANPPRAGLGEAVARALNAIAPSELRIMSCSAKSFARDLAVLRERFELVRLIGVDTLPHTGHLELVATLRRRD